jgi:hypothetical protein
VPSIFILEADRDELVPKTHGEALFQRCQDLGIPVEKGSAPVAYHSESIARGEGQKIAAQAILTLTKRALDQQGRGSRMGPEMGGGDDDLGGVTTRPCPCSVARSPGIKANKCARGEITEKGLALQRTCEKEKKVQNVA